MNPTFLSTAERVIAALGNGLLQGLVLGLATWAALRTLRRASAATRYAVECAALAVIALLPGLHLALSFSRPATPPTPEPGRVSLFSPNPALVGAPESGISFPSTLDVAVALPDSVDSVSAAPAGVVLATPPVGDENEETGSESGPFSRAEAEITATELPETSAAPSETRDFELPAAQSRLGEAWRRLRLWMSAPIAAPAPVIAGLALAWTLVAAVRLALLARQLLALRRIKRDAEAPPTSLGTTFTGLSHVIAPHRDASLGIGADTEIAAPMATGYLHPMVLLPAGLVDAPAPDFERVLRHELAHLRRYDDWTNLAQHVVRAVLFFHPAVIWLTRRMDIDREIACDDHVLAAAGRERARDYALFLTDFARRTHGRTWSAAPAAWSNPTQLEERIRMLLNPNRNTSPRPARAGASAWIAGLAMLAALGLYATPRLSLAATLGNAPSAIADGRPAPEAAPAAPAEAPTPAALPAPEPQPIPATPALLPPEPPEPPSAALAGPEEPRRKERPASRPPEDASMEQRIERLERMVESLARRPGPDRPGGTARASSGARNSYTVTTPDVKPPKLTTTVRTDVDVHTDSALPVMRDIMAEVGRHVELATREAERAVREALESAKAALDSKEPKRIENIEQRRKALSEERRALQKQIAKVESQLEHLDNQLDRVDDLLDHQVDAAQALQESRKAQESLAVELRGLTDKARARARAAIDEARNSARERHALVIERQINPNGNVHEERILRSPDGDALVVKPGRITVETRSKNQNEDKKPRKEEAPSTVEEKIIEKSVTAPPAKSKDKSGDDQPTKP